MKKTANTLLLVAFMLACGTAQAQHATLRAEMKKGEVLRSTYRFSEAIAVFSRLLAGVTDSSLYAGISREIIRCENGAQLLQFAFTPQVVGKATVPLKNFYAFYDLDLPGAWALTPSTLLAKGDTTAIQPFLFVSTPAPESLYFSSRGADGRNGWDIYETHRMPNDEWSAPERLSETINTPFDERFPYVTPDGQTLYFSSNGHHGMGGFDLYKSTRHNGQWSAPENLGFPLSSVHDDMLYVPDADGLYACFVSTRDADNNQVSIYKIALEGTPVKHAVITPAEIRQLESLPLAAAQESTENPVSAETNRPSTEIEELRKKVTQQANLVNVAQLELDMLRAGYAAATREQQQSLAIKIELREQTIAQYYAELQQASADAQQAEYRMLEQGIAPVAEAAPAPEKERAPRWPKAVFAPKPGRVITLPAPVIQQPVAEVAAQKDFTFKTPAPPQIYYDEPVEGVSFRIQIGVFSRKLEARELKQFTPVFAVAQGGKWVYAIGSFSQFGEAQKHLPAVKRHFKDALIVAYKDGERIDVKKARTAEGKTPDKKQAPAPNQQTVYQIVLGDYPEGLPQNLQKTVQQATDKDIARATLNGKTEYVAGPYTRKSEADQVLEVLHRSGFGDTRVEAIN